MATDFLAIADAISTKAGAISGIRGASARVPDNLPYTPYAVVFPPDAKLTRNISQDVIESTFPVYLYLARPGDTARTLALVYPYINSFYTAWRSGLTLATANVQESYIEGHELDDLPDYGGRYLGIRFRVVVRTRENVTRTA